MDLVEHWKRALCSSGRTEDAFSSLYPVQYYQFIAHCKSIAQHVILAEKWSDLPYTIGELKQFHIVVLLSGLPLHRTSRGAEKPGVKCMAYAMHTSAFDREVLAWLRQTRNADILNVLNLFKVQKSTNWGTKKLQFDVFAYFLVNCGKGSVEDGSVQLFV